MFREKIERATLAHAQAWQNAPEDGTGFCIDYLGINLNTRNANALIAELEERFESLLQAEERRLNPTNIDFITDLMQHSRYGALAQLFVIDALGKWSDKIAACTPDQVDTPFINGEAWVGVAKEIQAKLAARNKR